ncbi:hypothetical protein O0I10_010616 [Lichtheimia ornata]|uniref:Tetratricopeptide repeat protein 1 n=1 Tax=Lichtheimia ornata TaxID=688661 RepID=A0AAD7UUA5_9FUNG|nr:uncharacterized protein O0I10_010616 [Lichtheimia ornata]KAJ8653694.1 hypothetical protein O0I10_010616 [Lichtheimia ornata]
MAVIEEISQDPIESKAPQQSQQQQQQQPNADEDGDVFFDSVDYEPEEYNRLLKEATDYKQKGNLHFAKGDYEQAIRHYEDALVLCPVSATKERAIYFGNITACHLKLTNYKDARDMATEALKLDPHYSKAILRRAQANEKMDTYSSLSDALEDYRTLAQQPDLDTHTKNECQRANKRLPPIIKERMEKEKEEMMGKLKDLGNTLLGKFGLSTDNFQMQQDPSTGSYSVNFVQR